MFIKIIDDFLLKYICNLYPENLLKKHILIKINSRRQKNI
jgi:hypothetical protein